MIRSNDLGERLGDVSLRAAVPDDDDRQGPVPLQDLRDALDSARIRALYQPIVGLRDGIPVAIEALARLSHPVRGTVRPDLFVPQIEDAGLALPLTEAVGHVAFAAWQGDRLAALGLSLALNFPLDVLLLPAALTWLDRARDDMRIPARNITVELTESRPVGQIATLAAAVSRLRRNGYALAIDDVGPNLRDHRALLALEFSSLKLDKQLVRNAMHAAAAEDFISRTTRAAHTAGMVVVAEGIAAPEHVRRMAALSVDQGQGFYFARPLAARSVARWRRDWLARAPVAAA